ncbi:MAG: hypothetical protein JNL54_00180 [Kineosporiaceae bacterium]|nr:hypothetical protein [Kineosporiaceae bacterium]
MKKLMSIVVSLAAALLLISPAPAFAWGEQSDCKARPSVYHTNRWDVFLLHHMDVGMGTCTDGTVLYWAKRPAISFPSKVPGSGLGENLDVVAGPDISSIKWFTLPNGKTWPQRITWRYSVRQCTPVWPVCQTFDYTASVFPAGSQICPISGKCDAIKHW